MHTSLKYSACNLLRIVLYKFSCKRYSLITKSVYVSNSDDVYENLAVEDWLYHKFDSQCHQLLFLWKNSGCIVIGRHQNPWLEANLLFLDEKQIQLARRNSGGGAVYHDQGNLNVTFFTSRKYYNRKNNLSIIAKALFNEWDINVSVNDKDDIIYDGKKVSGTAAKLGSHNTYHHCTVLVDSDKRMMSESLHKNDKGIMTNATASRPSDVVNLREINNTINVDRLMTVIGLEYLRTCPVSDESNHTEDIIRQDGFHIISPNERFFPGLNEKISELKSWKWIFGRTPKFKVTRSYNFEALRRILPNCTLAVNVVINVNHGIVDNIKLEFPTSFLTFLTSDIEKKITCSFINQSYSESLYKHLLKCIDTELSSVFNDERIVTVL